MDNGEVIPGLNEDWTFAGAKLFEWLAGFMMAFLLANCFDKVGKVIPLLAIVWIGTTLFLAVLRKQFPDEERGLRNMCMVFCGFEPPSIPAPSKLQPFWSGHPMREMKQKCQYLELGLEEVYQMQREKIGQMVR
jgi:hypothetical protein